MVTGCASSAATKIGFATHPGTKEGPQRAAYPVQLPTLHLSGELPRRGELMHNWFRVAENLSDCAVIICSNSYVVLKIE
jgi:hypothetical protein